MRQRHLRIELLALIGLATTACGTGVSSPVPMPAAASFEEYAVSFCSAWDAIFLAVGNPDTAEGSVMSKALDDAVAARNGPEAERLAAEITAELKSGRRHAAIAGGWPPAAPAMSELDRVFAGYEAMTAAKAATAKSAPDAVNPQTAFEQAGGVDGFFAMIEGLRAMASARPAGAQQCPNLPIGP